MSERVSVMSSFRIAPMSTTIQIITIALLVLPVLLILGVVFGMGSLIIPAILLLAIYSWIWLRLRPTQFVVHQNALEVIWPLKRQEIPRNSISGVRIIDGRDLGWCMRIGAGGLWGGFGWLWTRRRGVVQMYISRKDNLVLIERTSGRSWLISPERPQEFVKEVCSALSLAAQQSPGADTRPFGARPARV